MPPRKAPPPPPVATQGQVAAVYGISVKHVDACLAKGAPQRGADGFDLVAWGRWWAEQGRFARLGGQAAPDGEEAAEGENWRRRKDRADALLAEQKLRDLLDVYARRDEVDRAAARDFTTLRLILETLPERCAALVPREQTDAVLDAVSDTVHAALVALRTALARWSGREDVEPIHDALQAAHRGLGQLPARLGKCVRGEKQKARLIAAARVAVAELRAEMARAVVDETDGR